MVNHLSTYPTPHSVLWDYSKGLLFINNSRHMFDLGAVKVVFLMRNSRKTYGPLVYLIESLCLPVPFTSFFAQ